MAELMLGQPLFPGESGIDQLVEIIKVLGTPSREQIKTMNPNYMEHKFPQIKPHPFSKVSLLGMPLLHLLIMPFVAGLPTSHSFGGDRFGREAVGIYTWCAVECGGGDDPSLLRRVARRRCQDAQRKGIPATYGLFA
jgi:hypothetical protein